MQKPPKLKVTILSESTASYCKNGHPLFTCNFVDVDVMSQDLDIIQFLSDIQWNFTLCLNG